MSVVAGYNTLLKVAGAPVAFADEPMSDLASTGTTIVCYITDRSKSAFVPGSITVNIENINSNQYTFEVDYLFGVVTIRGIQSAIKQIVDFTVSGQYYPLTNAAGITNVNLNVEGTVHDVTDNATAVENDGHRIRIYGLNSVSLSFENFYTGDSTFKASMLNRKRVLADVSIGAGKERVRGWFVTENTSLSGETDGVESASVSLQLDGDPIQNFSWRQAL